MPSDKAESQEVTKWSQAYQSSHHRPRWKNEKAARVRKHVENGKKAQDQSKHQPGKDTKETPSGWNGKSWWQWPQRWEEDWYTGTASTDQKEASVEHKRDGVCKGVEKTAITKSPSVAVKLAEQENRLKAYIAECRLDSFTRFKFVFDDQSDPFCIEQHDSKGYRASVHLFGILLPIERSRCDWVLTEECARLLAGQAVIKALDEIELVSIQPLDNACKERSEEAFVPEQAKSIPFGILHGQDLSDPNTAWPESMHLVRFRMQCENELQCKNELDECSFGMLFVCAAKSTGLKDMLFHWNNGLDQHHQAFCECTEVNWLHLKEQACDGVICAEDVIRKYHEHVLYQLLPDKRPSHDPYVKNVQLPTQALLVRLVKGDATSAIQIDWKEMMNTIKQSIDDTDPCDAAAEAFDMSYDLFLDDFESSRKMCLVVNEISLATLQEKCLGWSTFLTPASNHYLVGLPL